MSLPILVIRPEPGCAATLAAAREQDMSLAGYPLSRIEPVEWSAPEGPFDALLIGSANALRQFDPLVDRFADKPVYAVGESTAAEAKARGLSVTVTGSGGLQDLLDALPPAPLRLLRLAGAEHVSLEAPAGVEILTAITYRAEHMPMPDPMAADLRKGAIVLLHSAAAARHLAVECDRLAIPRDTIHLAALGLRIAAAAGPGWARVCAAAEPNDRTLLALARQMCHETLTG